MKNLILIITYVLASSAFATDDAVVNDPLAEQESFDLVSFVPLRATDAYARAQAVFNYFKLSPEPSNEDALRVFQSTTTLQEMKQILEIFDVEKQFPRFMRVTGESLEVYKDRDQYSVRDFSFNFSQEPGQAPVSDSIANLNLAKENPPEKQLAGLRIAIDPGHMSTREWDLRTGKFVKDIRGTVISEGIINLQTALVLKAELEKLGASVLVTREDHEPVTKVPLRDLDVKEYGRQALREKSLEDWFQSLLTTAPAGPALFRAFEESSKVQALFKESARDNYFILREDLQARVDLMDSFQPDISLVLHYDSVDPAGDPNGVGTRPYSKVKTYVHGALAPGEWATQNDRLFALLHVLNPSSWNASFNLAKSVVDHMSSALGLPHDVSGGGNSRLVAPGVFARNLFITRKMHGHAHTYVECLHYNDQSEFKALQQKDYALTIDGQTTYYSKRLEKVAFGIRDGVVNFVKNK